LFCPHVKGCLSSHEFLSQGILVALVIRTRWNLWEFHISWIHIQNNF
jgi:hypothetical protein